MGELRADGRLSIGDRAKVRLLIGNRAHLRRLGAAPPPQGHGKMRWMDAALPGREGDEEPRRRVLQGKAESDDGMSMDTIAIIFTVLVGAAGYLVQVREHVLQHLSPFSNDLHACRRPCQALTARKSERATADEAQKLHFSELTRQREHGTFLVVLLVLSSSSPFSPSSPSSSISTSSISSPSCLVLLVLVLVLVLVLLLVLHCLVPHLFLSSFCLIFLSYPNSVVN